MRELNLNQLVRFLCSPIFPRILKSVDDRWRGNRCHAVHFSISIKMGFVEFDYTVSIETYRYLDSRAFCHIKTVRMRITLTPIFEEVFLLEFIDFKDTNFV